MFSQCSMFIVKKPEEQKNGSEKSKKKKKQKTTTTNKSKGNEMLKAPPGIIHKNIANFKGYNLQSSHVIWN